jgi:hypothetical protein
MRGTTDLRSDDHSRPVLSCGEPAISVMQSALFSSVIATATCACVIRTDLLARCDGFDVCVLHGIAQHALVPPTKPCG